MHQLLISFLVAAALNTVWENAHSVLYTNYRGGPITPELLVFMAAKDALIICASIAFAEYITRREGIRYLTITLSGFLIAWGVELHALATHRWGYATSMPLLPIIHIGFTPAIQLALLGVITYAIRKKVCYTNYPKI